MTKDKLLELANAAVKTGNWIIRGENPDGSSASPDANGFKWNPVGEWTEAPDWNKNPVCGGGLHGQDKNHGGYICGSQLVFCDTEGVHIALDDKVKVQRARRLLINTLPDNLSVGGSLYLSGCIGLTTLPDNLSVDGYLDLSGCIGLTTLPDNLSVGGGLDLSECTGLPIEFQQFFASPEKFAEMLKGKR